MRDTKATDKLTRLEYQCSTNVDIPAIARRLYSLFRANQRTDDERGGLADTVEGSELYSHGEMNSPLWSSEVLWLCEKVKRMICS